MTGTVPITSVTLAAGVLLILSAFLSFVCSLLTLRLIYVMKTRNGYILLIVSLSMAQLLYDTGFLLVPLMSLINLEGFLNFVSCFAGLMASFWTNVISLIVLYIVLRLSTVNIIEKYHYFAIPIVTSTLIIATLNTIYTKDINILYFILRGISIIINIVVYIAVRWKLNRMSIYAPDITIPRKKRDPIFCLAERLKYYPLAQIACRIGAFIWELCYGHFKNNYSIPLPLDTKGQLCLYLYVTTNPLAGVFFLMIFLKLQPAAKSFFNCNWWKILLCYDKSELDQSSLVSLQEKKRSRSVSSDAKARVVSADPYEFNQRLDMSNSSGFTAPFRPDFNYSTEQSDLDMLDEDELSQEIQIRYGGRSLTYSADNFLSVDSFNLKKKEFSEALLPASV